MRYTVFLNTDTPHMPPAHATHQVLCVLRSHPRRLLLHTCTSGMEASMHANRSRGSRMAEIVAIIDTVKQQVTMVKGTKQELKRTWKMLLPNPA